MISVDLPDPDTPVTATKQPSGMSTSMFCRLCSRAPLMADPLVARLTAQLGHRDEPLARQVLAGDRRAWSCSSPSTEPECDDLAAVLAGARADVDHVVGDADGVLVVLDDQHGVADVAQADAASR